MVANVISPETTEGLFKAIDEHKDKEFRFGAGYTDLLVELKKQPNEKLVVINLTQLNDKQFTTITESDCEISIGALVTASEIISNELIRKHFPVLCEAANKHASRQIRQVATIGGNLCTASPAGDLACALVALKSECEIVSTNGESRVIPIDSFFVDVRKTELKNNEVLRSITIPKNVKSKNVYSGFIKVGVRHSMECAVVSLAYHIQSDISNKITHAGIAIGSVAPTIKFVQTACNFLIGKEFRAISKSDAEEFAGKVLEYANPISDIRASAWYRKEVLFNISKSTFDV
ncbi:MAG: FAD binding domain-containing protein [Bacteroidetes bacterium]|nr:FAD binding domain-containing protein [Bacteroidota bacterium]